MKLKGFNLLIDNKKQQGNMGTEPPSKQIWQTTKNTYGQRAGIYSQTDPAME